MTGQPRHVVIVGRDAALWLTATALMSAFRSRLKVTAVELPSQLRRSSAYATLPALEALHARLGISETQLLLATGGSFSLGWNVVWQGAPPFMIAHGSYGAPIDGGDFFHHWQKARRFGLDVALESFSPTAMAARNGRILIPDEATEAFGRTDYGYHLPALAYCSILNDRAHRLGVTMVQTHKLGVERNGVTGDIASIIADQGTCIGGDLFVDASGAEARLIGQELGVQAEDWHAFFPFDRMLSAAAKPYSTVPAYAELRLGRGSWTALHGSRVATHVVHADASAGSSAEAALANAAQTSGLALSEVALTACNSGIRTKAWEANCVAIGGAACRFDPLFDLELHGMQLGIVHLLSLFPTGEASAERAEYNRVTRSLFERLRDFQAAFYVLSASGAAVPPTLHQKLDTFEARGMIAAMEDETFSPDQWRALFVGMGISPETWPPMVDASSPEQMKLGFRRILRFVHEKVLEQPKHHEYLESLGAGSEV